ncbi:urease accessory protein UreF, partial [Streptomyces sp. NPDC002596]
MSRAALLVLADGRFPAGGHAHSGGAEPAVEAGRIRNAEDLAAFCRGRLHTTGLTREPIPPGVGSRTAALLAARYARATRAAGSG